jgi:formyl-CoA transferase
MRFATNPGRVTHRAELVPILESEFARETSAHWIERLNVRGVPCGPVNSLAEVFADEHFQSTGMLQSHEHASAGAIPMLASPLWVDGERLPIRRPPPALGQHNEDGGWIGSSETGAPR